MMANEVQAASSSRAAGEGIHWLTDVPAPMAHMQLKSRLIVTLARISLTIA
jgi:hypothetical protein